MASFELNPGRALFVGYIDRLEPLGVEAPFPVFPTVQSVGRQAFAKFSWLFRY